MKTASKTRPRKRSTAVRKSATGAVGSAPLLPVQFLAERAHSLVDALHARARNGIDRVQDALTQVNMNLLLDSSQPLAVRAGRFVRQNPMRAGAIVVLAAGAALLTRVPAATRS